MARPPLPCPVCAALVTDDAGHIEQHITWHQQTKTLGPKHGAYGTAEGLRAGFAVMRRAVEQVTHAAGEEDYPTAKLPPVRETVLRRPPPPEVRELKGRALLLAIAAELRDDLADEDDQP